jgi:hypothetical protein
MEEQDAGKKAAKTNDDDEDEKRAELIESLQKQLAQSKTAQKRKTLELKKKNAEINDLNTASRKDARRLLRSILLNIRTEMTGIPFDLKALDIQFPLVDEKVYETEFRERLVLRLVEKPKGWREYDWYFRHLEDQGTKVMNSEIKRVNTAIEAFKEAPKKEVETGEAIVKLQLAIPTLDPEFVLMAVCKLQDYYDGVEHGYSKEIQTKIKKKIDGLSKFSKTNSNPKFRDATQYFLCLVEFQDKYFGLWSFLLEKTLERDIRKRNLVEAWWKDPQEHFHQLSIKKAKELEKQKASNDAGKTTQVPQVNPRSEPMDLDEDPKKQEDPKKPTGDKNGEGAIDSDEPKKVSSGDDDVFK